MSLLDILNGITAIAFAIAILSALIGALVRPWRAILGIVIFIGACVTMFDVWIWSLVTVHDLWGTIWVVVGIVIGGIGVTPMAVFASLFAGDWTRLGLLIGGIIAARAMQICSKVFNDA